MSDSEIPELRFAYMVASTGNLPRLRDWYCDMLGFRCIHSGELAAVGSAFAVLEGHGMKLELTSPLASPVVPPAETDFPACMAFGGWKVLTLSCQDLPALDALLRRKGADIVWSLRQLTPRFRSTQVRDPDGNLVNIFG